MGQNPLRIRFVFGSGLHLGARLMGRTPPLTGAEMLRIQMLKQIRPYLPDTVDLGLSFFGGRILNFERWLALQKPAVFILSKHLVYTLNRGRFADKIRHKAILVGVDHHDGDMSQIDLSKFDLHLSISHAGNKALNAYVDKREDQEKRRPITSLLMLTPDSRLPTGSSVQLSKLEPIYVGLKMNADIPEEIADEIRMFEVVNSKQMLEALPHLPNYNFHYAIRPAPPDDLLRVYKPFTKGFTAAVLKSNILVNRADDDAVHFLSEDYPYLVQTNSAEDIVRTFRFAQESYGSSEWTRGLEIMEDVRQNVTPERLARQFMDMVKAIG